MRDTVTVYTDAAGLTRWRWASANGKTLGDSGQGYVDGRNCWVQARRLADGVGAELIDAR